MAIVGSRYHGGRPACRRRPSSCRDRQGLTSNKKRTYCSRSSYSRPELKGSAGSFLYTLRPHEPAPSPPPDLRADLGHEIPPQGGRRQRRSTARSPTPGSAWRRPLRPPSPSAQRARWAKAFREAMADFAFLPAGRILAGAGTGRSVTLFNCFVMGRIEDDLASIFENVKEAALTMQQGGGIGHDFSTLRPKGALVKSIGADASGPVSFMDVWDAMCRTIMSAGARRGAMMATLALRPSRHRGLHRRQVRPRAPAQFQSLRAGDRRLHARGAQGRAAGRWCSTARSTTRCAPARCGTASCAPPTTMPSPASSSSTASTPPTTSPTARRSAPRTLASPATRGCKRRWASRRCAISSGGPFTARVDGQDHATRTRRLLSPLARKQLVPPGDGRRLLPPPDRRSSRQPRNRDDALLESMRTGAQPATLRAGDLAAPQRPSRQPVVAGRPHIRGRLPAGPAGRRRHAQDRQGGSLCLAPSGCSQRHRSRRRRWRHGRGVARGDDAAASRGLRGLVPRSRAETSFGSSSRALKRLADRVGMTPAQQVDHAGSRARIERILQGLPARLIRCRRVRAGQSGKGRERPARAIGSAAAAGRAKDAASPRHRFVALRRAAGPRLCAACRMARAVAPTIATQASA